MEKREKGEGEGEDVEEVGRVDQKFEGFKQQLADQPALEPIDDLVELEEFVKEV